MAQTLSFAFKGFSDQFFAALPGPETYGLLTGRTFLVTGSNTGIGLGLATHIALLQPAQLILAVRDLNKGQAAKESIVAQTGFKGALEVWELDMADFASVKRFADRVNTDLKRLDGANLNAAVDVRSWGVTADGWERILQVNALSTGLLGVLLLPLLQATTKLPLPHTDASRTPPHLTITGSAGMYLAKFSERSGAKLLETLNNESESNIIDRYNTSKLFNLFLAREIATLPQAKGVVVNVVHPGLCTSELGRDLSLSPFTQWMVGKVGWTPAKGALNVLYALLRPTPPGAYIAACAEYPAPSWTVTKPGLDLQRKLWSEMVELWTGIVAEVSRIVEQ
ncbi:hypothetical protein B0H16DRAFT_128083 [Mycena metata]|uniref:NAD(P)-binding protein n=1 Tax=Mycena metata TaxID=1033252 RepID=A0AAD7I754_9AGAR|nr:hypothetical protein B0H16DRAFT_128083 [Mycena metata]